MEEDNQLIEEVQPSVEVDSYFESDVTEGNLFPDEFELDQVTTPDQTNRTALLSALALVRQNRLPEDRIDVLAQQNKTMIEQGMENDLRSSIDTAQKNMIKDTFYKDVSAAGLEVELADDPYSLEEQGVAYLIDESLKDKEQVDVYKLNEDLDFEIQDYMTKTSIMQAEIAKLKAEEKDRPYLMDVVDVLTHLAGPADLIKEWVGFSELDADLPILPGQRKEQGRQALFDLPLDEFKKTFPKMVERMRGTLAVDNPAHAARIVEEWQKGVNVETENFFAALDVGGSIGEVAGIATLINKLNPLSFVKTASRRLATTTGLQKFFKGTDEAHDVIKLDHVVDSLLPNSAKTTTELSVGLSGDLNRAIDEQTAITDELLSNRHDLARLDEEGLAAAIEDTTKRLTNRYKANHVTDIVHRGADEVTGLHEMDILMGKADGKGGFASEAMAKRSANKRGLTQDVSYIQDESGQWFINKKAHVREQGFVPVFDKEEVRATGPVAAINAFATWGPKKMTTLQNQAGSQINRWILKVNELKKPIQKLKGSQKARLDEMLIGIRDERKWLNSAEYHDTYKAQFGEAPDDKEINAYLAYVDAQNFDWVSRETNRYINDARKGRINLNMSKAGYNDKAVPINLKETENLHAYNVTDGVTYDKKDVLTKEGLAKLEEEGYIAYRLESRTDLPEVKGDHYNIVIGKPQDFEEGLLKWGELGHIEGPHVMYPDNTLFVKQAKISTRADGSKYAVDDVTRRASQYKHKADEYATQMNKVLDDVAAYRRGDITEEVLEDSLNDVNIRDMDHFEDLVDEGEIIEGSRFEVVLDGDKTEALKKTLSDGTSYLGDDTPIDDTSKFYINKSKRYTGKRGEDILLDVDDEQAKVLKPIETLDRALNNAIKTNVMDTYKSVSVESWAETFKDVLKDGNKGSKSAVQLFTEGVFDESKDIKTIERARSVRDNIIRQIGTPTYADKKLNNYRDNLAGWLEQPGIGKYKVKSGLSYAGARRAANFNPVSFARQTSYHALMGFLAPTQILMQTQTAVVASAISPKGPKAMGLLWDMRRALFKNADEVAEIAKEGRKVTGMDESNFLQLAREGQDTGFLYAGDESRLFAATKPGNIGSTQLKGVAADAADAIKKTWGAAVHKVSPAFLHEAERTNRIVAWNIAYLEELEKSGEAVLTVTDAVRGNMLNRANDLSMHMNVAGKTSLSQGVKSMGLQFQQYGVNQLFTTLPGISRLGNLSTKDKGRYLAAALTMYGAEAVPLGRQALEAGYSTISDAYTALTGDEELPPAAIATLHSGIWDGLLYSLTDGDVATSFGTRAGMNQYTQSVLDMVNDKTVSEVVLGPQYQTNFGAASTMWGITKYMLESFNSDRPLNTGRLLTDMAKRVTSTGRTIDKLFSIRKGVLMSSSGYPLSEIPEESKDLASYATLLGLPLKSVTDTYLKTSIMMDDKDVAKQILKEWRKADYGMIHSESLEDMQYWADVKAMAIKGESEAVKQMVQEGYRGSIPETLEESISKKYEKYYPDSSMNKFRKQDIQNKIEKINIEGEE